MKKNPVFSVILLISIYCFGLTGNASILYNSYSSGDATEQDKYSSTHWEGRYLYTSQSENLVQESTDLTNYSFKLPYNWYCSASFANQLRINAVFKQYLNGFQNKLIRSRKADLIYPFHNFW